MTRAVPRVQGIVPQRHRGLRPAAGLALAGLVLSILLGGACRSALAANYTISYAYDSLGRLTQVVYGTGERVVYTYDAAGNRLTQAVSYPVTVFAGENGAITGTGIQCGDTGQDCRETYASGTRVTLTAAPNPGYQFEGWAGCPAATGAQCTLDVTQTATVSATFKPLSPSLLTVTKAGTGTGTVVSDPVGILCGDACLLPFATGQTVTLTATATPGATFQGWTGEGCSGTGPCQVTMTQARSVTATFTVPPPPLAGLVLYDDFTALALEVGKWRTLETVRELRDGRLVLAHAAVGPPGTAGTVLPVAHPETIQSLAADVRLTAVAVGPATTARVGLRGSYYSDGTAGPGATGDVRAELYLIGNAAGDGADVQYCIYRCTSGDCAEQAELAPPTALDSAALGAVRTLGIAWSGTAFTFTVNGVDTVVSPTAAQPVVRATPSVPEQALSSQLRFGGAGGQGSVAGDFDNVLANGLPYDDFQAARLAADRWQAREIVREVRAGQLVTAVAAAGPAGTVTANPLPFLDQNGVTAAHAEATILTASTGAGDSVELRALEGSFYNDGTSGGATDRTGDVHAAIRILSASGGPLTAAFLAERCASPDCGARTALRTDTLGTVGVEETHRLFLKWDGSVFTYGLDSDSRSFDPRPQAPVARPAIGAAKDLGTRALAGTDGSQAFISAKIDNVFTNASAVPPPGLSPFLTRILRGGVVAAGVGVAGTGAGTIEITGIPFTATIDRAYLYWGAWGTAGTATALTLNGAAVTGTRIGQGDGVWGAAQAFAYRADVTALVTGNGAYEIAGLPHSGPAVQEALGATLVVLYALDGAPERVVVIRDGAVTLDSTRVQGYGAALTGFVAGDPVADATLTFITGGGGAASSQSAGANGTLIATDPFRGSDGGDWDTRTYDLSGALVAGDERAEARVSVTSSALVWIAAVASVPGSRSDVSLTITKSGAGAGTVSADEGSLSCGGDCSRLYPAGSVVTLTASPATGSAFTAWGGACSGTAPSCTLTLEQAMSVSAAFTASTYPLTVAIAGSSGGSVTSAPAGISCSGTCSHDFPSGATITLTASAGAGGAFRGWRSTSPGEPCNNGSIAPTCLVTMTAAKAVTAVFSKTFTDPSLASGTVIRAVHFIELRDAINALRSHSNGLGPFAWSGTTPASGGVVNASHLTDLRTALDQAYAAASKPPHAAYTDSTIGAKTTPIKAAHLNELRKFVRDLE